MSTRIIPMLLVAMTSTVAARADRLAVDLLEKGHRVLAPADTVAKLSSGGAGAPDWAARVLQTIDGARAALTRLDRRTAAISARSIREELIQRGGGTAGSEVLVEWCLLERQIALTGSDSSQAGRWLADAASLAGAAAELDPFRHPDDERDLFARRRAAMRSERAASLSVTTSPVAAEVWVDGTRRCTAPCSVTLTPGRHLALISAPARVPASLDVTLAPGESSSRELGLSAAYAGASPRAIGAMLGDPTRRAEGASALEPMARFLDVDHVVAVVPEGDDFRVLVSPPLAGRARIGPLVPAKGLSPAVVEQLRGIERPEDHAAPPTAWYQKPGTWIAGIGVVAAIVGGILIYDAAKPAKTGTITVTSP